MGNLQHRLMSADRQTLLVMLAQVIHELTICSRYLYDDEKPLVGLREINEAIHRVSGRLRDLIDPGEPFTASRAIGIAAASELMPQSVLSRIYGFTV